MRISLRISLEDIFLPYLPNFSAELVLTDFVLEEILLQGPGAAFCLLANNQSRFCPGFHQSVAVH
jgi:hypothetical protein